MANSVSIDDLLFIIGSKEAALYLAQHENARLRNELKELAAQVPPPAPPPNVLPFPGVPSGKAD